jgi:hypothetical protein
MWTWGWLVFLMEGCCSVETCPPEKESGSTGDTGDTGDGLDSSGSWMGFCEDSYDKLNIEMELSEIEQTITGELIVFTGYTSGPNTIDYALSGSRTGPQVSLDLGYAAAGTFATGHLELVLQDNSLDGQLTDDQGTSMSCEFMR